MIRDYASHKRLFPLAVYALLISLILLMRFIFPWPYVITVSAVLMLSVPFILKSDMQDLRWDPKGTLVGLAVSIVLLLLYLAVLVGYGMYKGLSLELNFLSYSFVLTQLLLVALPEEVFFRGYLQYKLGNNIKGIVIVSLLFALGHFVTLCIGGGHNIAVCSQAVLTFFPSLVMGYLYFRTKTLWASILFHFLANVVYIAVGLA
jgi:membrane protease YdiL (CAAX protease family)